MTRGRVAAGAAFSIVLGLAACAQSTEPPLVRACLLLGRPELSANRLELERRCRCADQAARRQFDPDSYALVADVAEAMASDQAAPAKASSASSAMARFQQRHGRIDTAIAVADLAVLTVKLMRDCALMPAGAD